jgi:hypothetical protein
MENVITWAQLYLTHVYNHLPLSPPDSSHSPYKSTSILFLRKSDFRRMKEYCLNNENILLEQLVLR